MIRCSRLPLAWACAPSLEVPEVRINTADEPAELGNAAHRYLASHVLGRDLDIPTLAREHGADADELAMLCHQGRKAWQNLSRHFDTADTETLTEQTVAGFLADGEATEGTADVLARSGRTAIVLDWKSGRVDRDHTHQVRGYALGAVAHFGRDLIDEAIVIVVWLREGVWDIERLSVDQLDSWSSEFSRRLANGRGTFNPGGHCDHCGRAAECPGRRAMVRGAFADMSIEGAPVIHWWTPQTRHLLGPDIGTAYSKIKLVQRACETFQETVKADVIANGPLPIGGGRELAITTIKKRELDATKARPVLAKWLTPEQIDVNTKISVSGCEDDAAALAGKGKGAGTRRDMAAALTEVGAVRINEVHQLREQKEVGK